MSQGFNPPSGGSSFGSSFGQQPGSGGASNAPASGSGFGAPSSPGGSAGFGGNSGNSSSGGAFGASPFGAPASSTSRPITKAPVAKLIPSLVLAIIGIGLNMWLLVGDLVATDQTFVIVAGLAWVLSGIGGFSFLGLYFSALNHNRAHGIFSDEMPRRLMFYATNVLLVIAVLWSAFNIAQFFGKL